MSDGFLDIVAPEPADVASPCVNVCVIGDDGLCAGCARTLAEIADWSGASWDERRAVLAALPGRREPADERCLVTPAAVPGSTAGEPG